MQDGEEVLSDGDMLNIYREKLRNVESLKKKLQVALKDFALFMHPESTTCKIHGDVLQDDDLKITLQYHQFVPKWCHLLVWNPESL